MKLKIKEEVRGMVEAKGTRVRVGKRVEGL